MSEKFPWLFERRYGIAAYDYWWGYTSAQIDLMIADQPVISYKTEKKGRNMMASKSEVDELDALTAAWQKKRNGKSFAGDKFSLEGFLKDNTLSKIQ